MNYAVNNDVDKYFPRVISSFPGIGDDTYLKLNDGQYWYYTETTGNRWTSEHSTNDSEYVGIDFGIERPVEIIKAYFFADEPAVTKPSAYKLEYWDGNSWQEIPGQRRSPAQPEAGRANTISFEPINTSRIKLTFPDTENTSVGLSELEAWGKADFPLKEGSGEIKNLAYRSEFSNSYTSRFDNVKGINDGLANPTNRWTAYESPNAEDWIQFDFGSDKEVSRANLYFFNDNGGVQPPADYVVKYWNGEDWEDIPGQNKIPDEPVTGLNQITFDPFETSRIRFYFTHRSDEAFAGLYEVELY